MTPWAEAGAAVAPAAAPGAGRGSRQAARLVCSREVTRAVLENANALFRAGKPFELLLLRFAGTALLLGAFAALRRRGHPGARIVVVGLSLGAFQVGANYALLVGFDRAKSRLPAALHAFFRAASFPGYVLLDG